MGDVFFFSAFFDNICYHLENGKWGSRFPTVMVDLYEYEVVPAKLEKLREELATIKEEFSKMPVEKIIWSIENLDKKCPYLGNLAEDIITLADFWRTSYESKDMFVVMNKAIDDGIKLNEKLYIREPDIAKKDTVVTYVSGAKDDKK